MPHVAENGSYAEPRRGSSKAWKWIYSPVGRMGRADFFYAILARAFAIALLLSLLLLSGIITSVPVWTIAMILTVGGPAVRRLHDIGQSGFHAPWLCLCLVLGCTLFYLVPPLPWSVERAAVLLLAAIPYLLTLALLLWPGTKGANRYGPPPTSAA